MGALRKRWVEQGLDEGIFRGIADGGLGKGYAA
jgi:hypothetical protein